MYVYRYCAVHEWGQMRIAVQLKCNLLRFISDS